MIEESRRSDNPWQRVVDNVDLGSANSSATSTSGRDMTRMKQAMLARKSDLTRAGSAQPLL